MLRIEHKDECLSVYEWAERFKTTVQEVIDNRKDYYWFEKQMVRWRERKRSAEYYKRRPKPYIPRKVQCIETGEIFDSCGAAAQVYTRVHSTSIANSARFNKPCTNGYHWRYV